MFWDSMVICRGAAKALAIKKYYRLFSKLGDPNMCGFFWVPFEANPKEGVPSRKGQPHVHDSQHQALLKAGQGPKRRPFTQNRGWPLGFNRWFLLLHQPLGFPSGPTVNKQPPLFSINGARALFQTLPGPGWPGYCSPSENVAFADIPNGLKAAPMVPLIGAELMRGRHLCVAFELADSQTIRGNPRPD